MTRNDHLTMEAVGEDAFLIRFGQGAEVTEIVLHLDAATMAALSAEGMNKRRVAWEVVGFLTERQRPDDLPASLDLADVAAAYDDWGDEVRTRLQRESQPSESFQGDQR